MNTATKKRGPVARLEVAWVCASEQTRVLTVLFIEAKTGWLAKVRGTILDSLDSRILKTSHTRGVIRIRMFTTSKIGPAYVVDWYERNEFPDEELLNGMYTVALRDRMARRVQRTEKQC
jgi:hypothetical protein